MSSYRQRKKNKLPPFVASTWEVLNSQAYISLAHAAGKALPYFLGKAKVPYNDQQRYLIEFPFSYSEGKRYGFAYSTFANVIQELIRKGFIDPVDKGGLRGDGKSCNLFRLSRRWEKYGKDGFESEEWSCFKPRMKKK